MVAPEPVPPVPVPIPVSVPDPVAEAVDSAAIERAKAADLLRDNLGLATVMAVFRGTIVRMGTEAATPAGPEAAAEIRPPEMEATLYDADLDESDAPME